jgi:hypothetical protein
LAAGERVPRADVEHVLGIYVVELLLTDGLLQARADMVRLAVAILGTRDMLTVAPDLGGGKDGVYLGLDSAYLIEIALRLAPTGERAADLGTGTGLLAAVLSRRYRAVVATDVLGRSATAAQLTLALNDRQEGHIWGTVVCDLANGLRPGSFDLVTANPPWVPTPPLPGKRRRLYRDGGPTGVESPARFLQAGAALLRMGGVSVTLALDVTMDGGRRPLREVCAHLESLGNATAIFPTPVNQRFPELPARMCALHPALVDAAHVAIVVVRPQNSGTSQPILVAAEALARRWRAVALESPLRRDADRVQQDPAQRALTC